MVWRQGESTGQPVTSASCSETPFQHRRSQKTEADTPQSLTEILWVEYKATRNSAQWPGKAVTSIHLPFNMERQTRHLKCSPWSRSGLLLTSAFQPCGVSQSRKKTVLDTADSVFLYLLIIFWQSTFIISHKGVNPLPNRPITTEAERKAWQRCAVASGRQQLCLFTSPSLSLLLNTCMKHSRPPGHRWAIMWAVVLTHRLEGLCIAQERTPPKLLPQHCLTELDPLPSQLFLANIGLYPKNWAHAIHWWIVLLSVYVSYVQHPFDYKMFGFA